MKSFLRSQALKYIVKIIIFRKWHKIKTLLLEKTNVK